MKKLEWKYIAQYDDYHKYEAITEFGIYTLYANDNEGVYEIELITDDKEPEQVCGAYNGYEAMSTAQDHYNAKVEANP
jgi:hypothetical protein